MGQEASREAMSIEPLPSGEPEQIDYHKDKQSRVEPEDPEEPRNPIFSEEKYDLWERGSYPRARLLSRTLTPKYEPVPRSEQMFYDHANLPYDTITSIRKFIGNVDCWMCREEIETKGNEITKMWQDFWSNYEANFAWTDKPWELKLPGGPLASKVYGLWDNVENLTNNVFGLWVSPTVEVDALGEQISNFWFRGFGSDWRFHPVRTILTDLLNLYPNLLIFDATHQNYDLTQWIAYNNYISPESPLISLPKKLVFVLPGPSWTRSQNICHPCTCAREWPPNSCYHWLIQWSDEGKENYLKSVNGKQWATSGREATDVLRSAWFHHWVRNANPQGFGGVGWYAWAEEQGGDLRTLSKKLQEEKQQARPEGYDDNTEWPNVTPDGDGDGDGFGTSELSVEAQNSRALEYSKQMLRDRGPLSTWTTSQVVAWLRSVPSYISNRIDTNPDFFVDLLWVPRFVAHKVTGATLDQDKSAETIVHEIVKAVPSPNRESRFEAPPRWWAVNQQSDSYIVFWLQALKAAANAQ